MYTKTLLFEVKGMTCVVCTGAVEKIINGAEYPENIKVLRSKANLIEESATVTLASINPINEKTLRNIEEMLCDEIEDIGLDCQAINKRKQPSDNILPQQPINESTQQSKSKPLLEKPKKNSKRAGWLQSDLTKSLLAYLFGFTLLTLSLLGVTIPFIALMTLFGFSFVVTLYGGWKHFKAACKYLFKRRMLTMDSLFTIGVALSWGLVIASLFLSFIPLTWPITPLLIVAGMCGGKYLEKKYHDKVKEKIKLTSILPNKVLVKRDENFVLTDIKQVIIGDIIQVNAGEVIPLDGERQAGNGRICTKAFNGRIHPIASDKIDDFVSGMRVTSGMIQLTVTKNYQNCYLVDLEKRINAPKNEASSQGENTNNKLERFSNKLVSIFIPSILIIAIISAIIAGYFLGPLAAIAICLSQISGACPCVLGWIKPLGKKMALNKSAKYGAELKSTAVLNRINSIDTYVFDLNGTLTKGKLTVEQCKNLSGEDNNFFFSILTIIEENANSENNIFGQAVLEFAQKNLPKGHSTLHYNSIKTLANIKSGVGVEIDGEKYYIGNITMLNHLGINHNSPQPKNRVGHTLFLVKEKQIIGEMVLLDSLRTDSAQIIQTLVARRKKIFICTGTDKETAKYYARELGINEDHIYADCTNKETYIKKIKNRDDCKGVAMIGDALNDLSAFSCADLKIATDCASKQNRQDSDICINSPDLQPILNAIIIAEDSAAHIKAMLIFTMCYNFLVIVLPIILAVTLITVNPAFFVAAMFLQAAFVLSFLWYKHNKTINTDSILSESNVHTLFCVDKERKMNEGNENLLNKNIDLIPDRDENMTIEECTV